MEEIHYLIGNKCNLNCDFCFSNKILSDSSFELKKKIVAEIVNSDIKIVTLSGGEPTIAKDFLKILKYMHSKGLTIILHTNGLKINKRFATDIAKYVSRVSLSLDGSNPKNSIKMRKNKNFFKNTLYLIDIFNALKKDVNVKTLVTKQNINDIINIGNILSKMPIKYWSLLEFNAINKAKINKQKYLTDQNEFEKVVLKCKKEFPNLNIKFRKYNDQEQKYCFIVSNGKVYTYVKDKGDTLIGNVNNENLKDIIKKIEK